MNLEEKYPYHVVEFVNIGRKPKVRNTDIIATKWLQYDKIKKKCVVKYPPPPYTQEKFEELNEMLLNLEDAAEEWDIYTVNIKGKANTYGEALEKLEILKEKYTALTLESDESCTEAEMKAAQQIKKIKLKEGATAFKNSIPTTSPLQNKSLHTDPKTFNNNINSNEALMDLTNLPVVTEEYLLNAESIMEGDFDFAPIRVPQSKNFLKDSQTIDKNSVTPARPKLKNLISNQKLAVSFQQTMIDCWSNVICQLQEIKSDLKDMKNDMQALKVAELKKSPNTSIVTIQQISEKYQYNIPFENVKEFEMFNSHLSNNMDLREEVCTVLHTAVDHSLLISRSIVRMLKMFLNKNLAVQYVAVQTKKNKFVMKNTSFFNCVEVVIKERRQISNQTTDDKEIITALSTVLSNAISWYSKSSGSVKRITNLENINQMDKSTVSEYTEPPSKVSKSTKEALSEFASTNGEAGSNEDSNESFSEDYCSQLKECNNH